ncbi:MAG: hypothetical protein MJ219_00650 [Mycoplasmoidaceae bacterium]|nr:hypothetical protein [Mycoplasmoidaceae bacterium]
MKKYRILPLIAITTLTGVTFPLVSCNKNKEEPLGPLCFTNVADNNENSVISYEAHGLTVGVDKDIDIEYTYTPDVDNSWQK